jgi:hypothetical protein
MRSSNDVVLFAASGHILAVTTLWRDGISLCIFDDDFRACLSDWPSCDDSLYRNDHRCIFRNSDDECETKSKPIVEIDHVVWHYLGLLWWRL